MFQNMKVSTRLFMGFGIVILIMIGIVVTSVTQMNVMDTAVNNVNRSSHNIESALRILDGVNSMRRFQLSALASAGGERAKELDRVTATGQSVLKTAEEVVKFQRRAETKKLAVDMLADAQAYAKGNEKLISLAREDKAEEMKALIQGDERKIQRQSIEAVEVFLKVQEETKESRMKEAQSATAFAEKVMYSLLAVSLLIGGAIAMWITRSITVPLSQAVSVTERMTQGDLTVRIESTSKDEVGQLLGSMRDMTVKFEQVGGEVRASAESLSSASEEVSATSQSMNQASSEQAASVEETSASIEQMTASITQNGENAKVTDGMAVQAAKQATEGGVAVQHTVAAVKEIRKKNGLHPDLPYHNQHLSLNAAIQTAPAGGHGQGVSRAGAGAITSAAPVRPAVPARSPAFGGGMALAAPQAKEFVKF